MAPKGKGGGKLARTETVTVRLDPKLRYGAELAARKQRRTVSSLIEWALDDSLKRLAPNGGYRDPGEESVMDAVDEVWDVDEADTFVRLALRYPYLLTHDEQILWKLVRENGFLWRGNFDKVTGDWVWRIQKDSCIFHRLREHWDAFQAVARGESDTSVLPTWVKRKEPVGSKPEPPGEEVDDIPS